VRKPVLAGERLHLRPVEKSDICYEYINGLNDPEVNKYLVDVRRKEQTFESVEEYIISNSESPSSVLLGIFIKESQRPFIGTIRAHQIDFFHYSATIGICLFAKRAWKKGYALSALEMLKDYLFKELGLHYLEAGVYAENTNSINLFTRAGFSEWYSVKDKIRFVNSFEEVIYFAALNPSFDMSLLKKASSSN